MYISNIRLRGLLQPLEPLQLHVVKNQTSLISPQVTIVSIEWPTGREHTGYHGYSACISYKLSYRLLEWHLGT